MTSFSTDIRFTILVGPEPLPDPRLQRLHDEWSLLTDGGRIPGLDFYDTDRLAYLQDALILLDIVRGDDGSRQYRYRHIGAQIVERRGHDRTGEWLHDHPERDFADAVVCACEAAAKLRQPVAGHLKRAIYAELHPVDILLLPLAGADGRVEQILAAQVYPPSAPRRIRKAQACSVARPTLPASQPQTAARMKCIKSRDGGLTPA